MFLHADSEDSDQTGWMLRLTCVFTGRTDHFVGFVMRWLICCWRTGFPEISYDGVLFLSFIFQSILSLICCCRYFHLHSVEQIRRVFEDNLGIIFVISSKNICCGYSF